MIRTDYLLVVLPDHYKHHQQLMHFWICISIAIMNFIVLCVCVCEWTRLSLKRNGILLCYNILSIHCFSETIQVVYACRFTADTFVYLEEQFRLQFLFVFNNKDNDSLRSTINIINNNKYCTEVKLGVKSIEVALYKMFSQCQRRFYFDEFEILELLRVYALRVI